MTATHVRDAGRYAYLLVMADVAEGYYPAGAILDGFTVLHDHIDANGYLQESAEAWGLPDDYRTLDAIADVVHARLQASPITVAVAA